MSELAYCKTHYISYCPELSATCPYCRIEKLEQTLMKVRCNEVLCGELLCEQCDMINKVLGGKYVN